MPYYKHNNIILFAVTLKSHSYYQDTILWTKLDYESQCIQRQSPLLHSAIIGWWSSCYYGDRHLEPLHRQIGGDESCDDITPTEESLALGHIWDIMPAGFSKWSTTEAERKSHDSVFNGHPHEVRWLYLKG